MQSDGFGRADKKDRQLKLVLKVFILRPKTIRKGQPYSLASHIVLLLLSAAAYDICVLPSILYDRLRRRGMGLHHSPSCSSKTLWQNNPLEMSL